MPFATPETLKPSMAPDTECALWIRALLRWCNLQPALLRLRCPGFLSAIFPEGAASAPGRLSLILPSGNSGAVQAITPKAKRILYLLHFISGKSSQPQTLRNQRTCEVHICSRARLSFCDTEGSHNLGDWINRLSAPRRKSQRPRGYVVGREMAFCRFTHFQGHTHAPEV